MIKIDKSKNIAQIMDSNGKCYWIYEDYLPKIHLEKYLSRLKKCGELTNWRNVSSYDFLFLMDVNIHGRWPS